MKTGAYPCASVVLECNVDHSCVVINGSPVQPPASSDPFGSFELTAWSPRETVTEITLSRTGAASSIDNVSPIPEFPRMHRAVPPNSGWGKYPDLGIGSAIAFRACVAGKPRLVGNTPALFE